VTRFGFLKENEKDWINPENLAIKIENAGPKLQGFTLKILESEPVEMFSLFMISIYTLIILFDLSLASTFNVNQHVLD
jgi:hypothetical protein